MTSDLDDITCVQWVVLFDLNWNSLAVKSLLLIFLGPKSNISIILLYLLVHFISLCRSLSRMISKFCLIIFNVSLDMLNTVIYIFETQATFDSGFMDITFILCNCFAIQLRALRRHSRWNPKQSWMNWPKCSAIEHCAQIGKCFGYSLRTELLQFNARAENIVFIQVSSFIRDFVNVW